jgi:hypothetical protein
MLKRIAIILLVVVLSLTVAMTAFASPGGRPTSPIVVYVTSQGLYYDSIPGPTLPMNGPFQLLEPEAGPHGGPQTEFGPGDPGYVGGRWWVDNGNTTGEMDSEDTFFLCPLLGPGRETETP